MDSCSLPVSMRRRFVSFAPEDERLYCDLLLSACPNVRFVPQLHPKDEINPETPTARSFDHISNCPEFWVDLYFTFPGWTLQYERRVLPQGPRWCESLDSLTLPSGYWRRTRPNPDWTIYANGVKQHPSVGQGEIVFRALATEPEQTRLIDRLLRLVSKVATNKYKIAFPDQPERAPVAHTKGGNFWAGHHAVEWVREHPDRVLSQASEQEGGYVHLPLD